jgi:hypothetical protein
MYTKIALEQILFLDIECVSQTRQYDELSEPLQHCWEDKYASIARREGDELSLADSFPAKAAVYSEFGKIICISVGLMRRDDNNAWKLRLKSFYGHDEKQLLLEFTDMLNKHFGDPRRHYLCGHNIKEFDVPYICRRMIINGLPLPPMLDLSGKKPWESQHLLDTMEMWSFGDRKAFTSLKLLCAVFGIPTPKDDISGADVGRVYWEEGDLNRIETYCKKDVAATVQVFLSYRGESLLTDEQVILV